MYFQETDQEKIFPAYDAEALEIAYEQIDYISVHHYLGNYDGDSANYLAKPITTNQFLEDVASTIAYVKRKRKSDHDVYISFDEFNTWHSMQTEN